MLVPPVAVVADANVLHLRLAFSLLDGNGEGKRTVRAVDVAAVAKSLLYKVVADLEAHLVGTIVSAIVGNRREVAARKEGGRHYLLDVIHQLEQAVPADMVPAEPGTILV